MGAWGLGAFDNDGAGDFHADLRNADPARREAVVREALEAAVEAGDYLENDFAEAAVAAAAAVAAGRSGGSITATDSGATLAAADLPSPSADLVALAHQALDRVVGADSEWRELWEEAGDVEFAQVLATVAEIRVALD